jgi:hypothetical protein
MKKIDCFLLIARHYITEEYLHVVGVFATDTHAVNARKKLKEQPADLAATYSIERFRINPDLYVTDTERIEAEPLPQYFTDAVVALLAEEELQAALREVTSKSINKILSEIEACADNPEVVREYIQGLRDNVEDYL